MLLHLPTCCYISLHAVTSPYMLLFVTSPYMLLFVTSPYMLLFVASPYMLLFVTLDMFVNSCQNNIQSAGQSCMSAL